MLKPNFFVFITNKKHFPVKVRDKQFIKKSKFGQEKQHTKLRAFTW